MNKVNWPTFHFIVFLKQGRSYPQIKDTDTAIGKQRAQSKAALITSLNFMERMFIHLPNYFCQHDFIRFDSTL